MSNACQHVMHEEAWHVDISLRCQSWMSYVGVKGFNPTSKEGMDFCYILFFRFLCEWVLHISWNVGRRSIVAIDFRVLGLGFRVYGCCVSRVLIEWEYHNIVSLDTWSFVGIMKMRWRWLGLNRSRQTDERWTINLQTKNETRYNMNIRTTIPNRHKVVN